MVFTVLLSCLRYQVDLLFIKATTLMFSQRQIGEPDTEKIDTAESGSWRKVI